MNTLVANITYWFWLTRLEVYYQDFGEPKLCFSFFSGSYVKNIFKLHIIYQKYDGILYMYDVTFKFIQTIVISYLGDRRQYHLWSRLHAYVWKFETMLWIVFYIFNFYVGSRQEVYYHFTFYWSKISAASKNLTLVMRTLLF